MCVSLLICIYVYVLNNKLLQNQNGDGAVMLVGVGDLFQFQVGKKVIMSLISYFYGLTVSLSLTI
jgi:hypothetical protein